MIFKLLPILFTNPLLFIIIFALIATPLLISITIHEWAHGFVAYKFGDPTPKEQGRLSFNPFAHLDPLGTLMLFIIGFGWAKPVQVNPNYIKGKTRMMLVALAGPTSNFLLAILFSILIFFVTKFGYIAGYDTKIIQFANVLLGLIVQVNIILGIFNMIPIPPLDGSNVLAWLLPNWLYNNYLKIAPLMFVALIILLYTGHLNFIFYPVELIMKYINKAVEFVFGPLFA